MRRLSTPLWAALVVAVVTAVALAATGLNLGGGPGRFQACLFLIDFIIAIAVAIALVCIRRCDEDRDCVVECFRTFILMIILVPILIIACWLWV